MCLTYLLPSITKCSTILCNPKVINGKWYDPTFQMKIEKSKIQDAKTNANLNKS